MNGLLYRERPLLALIVLLIVVGGVIPAADVLQLREDGVTAVFGPGTVIPDAARQLLAELAFEGLAAPGQQGCEQQQRQKEADPHEAGA